MYPDVKMLLTLIQMVLRCSKQTAGEASTNTKWRESPRQRLPEREPHTTSYNLIANLHEDELPYGLGIVSDSLI